jgi:hypothetical protein
LSQTYCALATVQSKKAANNVEDAAGDAKGEVRSLISARSVFVPAFYEPNVM